MGERSSHDRRSLQAKLVEDLAAGNRPISQQPAVRAQSAISSASWNLYRQTVHHVAAATERDPGDERSPDPIGLRARHGGGGARSVPEGQLPASRPHPRPVYRAVTDVAGCHIQGKIKLALLLWGGAFFRRCGSDRRSGYSTVLHRRDACGGR
jgi:hypothetical protein